MCYSSSGPQGARPFKMQYFTARRDLLVLALFLNNRYCKLLYLPIPLMLMGKNLRLQFSPASAPTEMNDKNFVLLSVKQDQEFSFTSRLAHAGLALKSVGPGLNKD